MNDELITAAIAARRNAYAPYSGYEVGAAIITVSGEIFSGCNVENASYGLSNCAERVAVGCMVTAGHQRAAACAVATENGKPPCGACLQVLLQFAETPSEFFVYTVSDNNEIRQHRLTDLLPYGFRL